MKKQQENTVTPCIITVFNQKGGVGKSSVSVNMAYELGLNHRVLLVDIDPQLTSTQWASASDDEGFPATVLNLAMQPKKIFEELGKHLGTGEYDYCIVDCPPHKEQRAARSALLMSDIALMPINPAPLDLWASDNSIELLNEVQYTNPKLKILVLGSMVKNTRLSKSVMKEVALTEGIIPLTKCLRELTAYSQAPLYGKGITGAPYSKKASEEFKQVLEEILSYCPGNENA